MKKLNKVLIPIAAAIVPAASCGILATTLTSCGTSIKFVDSLQQTTFTVGNREDGHFYLAFELTEGTIESANISVEVKAGEQAQSYIYLMDKETDWKVIDKTLYVAVYYRTAEAAKDTKLDFNVIIKHKDEQVGSFGTYTMIADGQEKIALVSDETVKVLEQDSEKGFSFPLKIVSDEVIDVGNWGYITPAKASSITIPNDGLSSIEKSGEKDLFLHTNYEFKGEKTKFDTGEKTNLVLSVSGQAYNGGTITSFTQSVAGVIEATVGAVVPENEKHFTTNEAESLSHSFVFKTLEDTTGYTFTASIEDEQKEKTAVGVELDGDPIASGKTISVPVKFKEGTISENNESSFSIRLICKNSGGEEVWNIKSTGFKLTYGAIYLELAGSSELQFDSFQYDKKTVACPEEGIKFKSKIDLESVLDDLTLTYEQGEHWQGRWSLYIKLVEDSIVWKKLEEKFEGYYIYQLNFSLVYTGSDEDLKTEASMCKEAYQSYNFFLKQKSTGFNKYKTKPVNLHVAYLKS